MVAARLFEVHSQILGYRLRCTGAPRSFSEMLNDVEIAILTVVIVCFSCWTDVVYRREPVLSGSAHAAAVLVVVFPKFAAQPYSPSCLVLADGSSTPVSERPTWEIGRAHV